MTKANFSIAHPWVLAHEGGYVDNPRDPGGATNQGVTQGTYNAYRKRTGRAYQSVRKLTAMERDTIYRLQYWDKLACDDLPSGVDYAVYDFGVNSGVNRSAKYLQKIVGVKQDGIIGLQTLAAVEAMTAQEVVERLCGDRMAFLRKLRHWPTFKNGWTRRVVGQWDGVQEGDHGVIDRGVMLANKAQVIPAPKVIADGSGARTTDVKTSPWASLFAAIAAFFRKAKS